MQDSVYRGERRQLKGQRAMRAIIIAIIAVAAQSAAAQTSAVLKGAACHANYATKMHCEDRVYPDLRRAPNYYVQIPPYTLFNHSIYKATVGESPLWRGQHDGTIRYTTAGDENRLYDVVEFRLPTQYNSHHAPGGNLRTINSGKTYRGVTNMLARLHIAPADRVVLNDYDEGSYYNTGGVSVPGTDTLWEYGTGTLHNDLFLQLRDDLELPGGHRLYILETRVFVLSRITEALGTGRRTWVTGSDRTRTGTYVDHLPIVDAHGVKRDFGVFKQDALQTAFTNVLQALQATILEECEPTDGSRRWEHWPGQITTNAAGTVEYQPCQTLQTRL